MRSTTQSAIRRASPDCKMAPPPSGNGVGSSDTAFDLPVNTPPMEARSAEELPSGDGWQFEPKWDGFRCLAFKAGDNVDLRAKSGKPLGRYFPEIVTVIRDLGAECFVVDGELTIDPRTAIRGDGRLSF